MFYCLLKSAYRIVSLEEAARQLVQHLNQNLRNAGPRADGTPCSCFLPYHSPKCLLHRRSVIIVLPPSSTRIPLARVKSWPQSWQIRYCLRLFCRRRPHFRGSPRSLRRRPAKSRNSMSREALALESCTSSVGGWAHSSEGEQI